MTLRVLVRNGTNHRELVPCYLIISLAKMFRYGPPGPKFLESTSLQGAWTHFSFLETGNDWRTNEVHSTPYENKSHHPWLLFVWSGRQPGNIWFYFDVMLSKTHDYVAHSEIILFCDWYIIRLGVHTIHTIFTFKGVVGLGNIWSSSSTLGKPPLHLDDKSFGAHNSPVTTIYCKHNGLE